MSDFVLLRKPCFWTYLKGLFDDPETFGNDDEYVLFFEEKCRTCQVSPHQVNVSWTMILIENSICPLSP